jgi:ABC-type dipeptide/oligopeptide/nickel transport system permease subunit
MVEPTAELIPEPAGDAEVGAPPPTTLRAFLGQTFRGGTLAGAALVAIVIVLAAGAPLFSIHDPQQQDVAHSLLPPVFQGGTWPHPLGTDALGRDLWARIVYGLRTSLLIAVPAVALGACVGLAVGLVAGYFGGWVDTVLMRLTDVQMAFPFIILAIAILSVTQPGPLVLIIVLSLSTWPTYARVIRSIVMVDGQSEYVLAARSMGASHLRVLVRYLLRNLWLSVAVLSTLDVATLIILEALLSFLGLGIQPPTPSLGNIMADGKSYLALGQWWPTTLPGVMILVTLLGLNLMGDGLQTRLDPRLRRR